MATQLDVKQKDAQGETAEREPGDPAPSRPRSRKRDRIAIVSALRSPFARRGTVFRDLSSLDLSKAVVVELLARSDVDPRGVDLVVFGQAGTSDLAGNLARDLVLAAGLPRHIRGYTVNSACASSLQALSCAAESMWAGQSSVAVVGGADSASDVPLRVSKRWASVLADLQRADSWRKKVEALQGLSPRDWWPGTNDEASSPSESPLVESAEKLAKEAGIRREAQDAFAHRSHQRAAAAWSSGRFEGEVMPIFTGAEFTTVVRQDNAVRQESNLSEYGKFSPVFDKKYGTVTLANSCATTDGAGALLLMTESAAKERGVRPLGYLRSWAYAALDPDDSPLLGPAHATPKALAEAGLSFQNLSLVEMHEASAAQVLSNQEAFASRSFASRQLGMGQAIGDLHEEILNVNGGSLAMGHPAAATGTRMVMQLLHELRRRGGGMGLVTTSALGGLGAALVVEVDS